MNLQLNVAAVILSWREVDATVRCAQSLVRDPAVRKVIVVDNESTGALKTEFSHTDLDVEVVELPENRGFAGGVNVGIDRALRDATVDAVLCINNDAVVADGAVSAMAVRLAHLRLRGVVGPTICERGTPRSGGGRYVPITANTMHGVSESPDYITWACVLVGRRVFEEVGPLDESFFMYWEDVEFGVRCRKRGIPLAIVPDAVVDHEVSASHSQAGSVISCYSSFGLVTLGRRLGGRSAIGAGIRVAGRTVAALVALQPGKAVFVLQGAWYAVRQGRQSKGWMTLRRAIGNVNG